MSDLKNRWRRLKFRIDSYKEGMTVETLLSRTPIDRLSLSYITPDGYFCRSDARLVFEDEESVDLELQSINPEKISWTCLTLDLEEYGRTWYVNKEFHTSFREYNDSRKALLIREIEKSFKK